MDLSGKIVVVTGGSGLLGSSFCSAIVKNGGDVFIADTDEVSAISLANGLNDREGRICAFAKPADINDRSSIESLIRRTVSETGRIDALVNNAYPRNKNYGKKFPEVSYEDFCENVNLNLGGYFLTSQLFIKYFLEQGYGNIINIASVYGIVAPRFEIYSGTEMTMPVEYSVIKSGLIHLTKYMAKFVKGKNIRINSLSPGGIINNQPESFIKNYRDKCLNKGMLDPDDVAGTLVFLISDLSLSINGENITVDDGFVL